ncbi:hypothetical protein ACFLW7_03635 [Chloroflexota bacterium]
MQTTRIARYRKAIDKRLREEMDSVRQAEHFHKWSEKDFSLTRLHCDYHFYFICIGQIGKLLKRLCELLKDPDLKQVYTKFEDKFDKDVRDSLEHIDERAIGVKKGEEIGHISDFGNFPGDRFSFDGKEYPVNRQSVRELKGIYEETINVLYKNYGSKDPGFVHREQSERRVKGLLRQLKRQGLSGS